MEKELDQTIRATLLELAQYSLKKDNFEDTKLFSGIAKQYGERLAKPYVQRDKWMRPVDNTKPLPAL